MVFSHREEKFVVIELGSYTTKATIDVSDVNKLPTVNIRTRAGILKPDSLPTPSNNMEVDQDQDQDEDSSKNNDSYLFGTALEDGDSSKLEQAFDIMEDGFVKDWDAMSAFLRHIITKELGIRISRNFSPILFSVPPQWPKTDLECLTQIAFEHLNTPLILVSEQPLLAMYGNGLTTGLVVDFGHSKTTVTAIVDSIIQTSVIVKTDVAGAAVSQHLHELLQADPEVSGQFEANKVPFEFAVTLKESGLCKFSLPPGPPPPPATTQKKSATAKAPPPPPPPPPTSSTFTYKDKQFTISDQILAKAPTILINPRDSSDPPISHLMRQAVLGCETEKRTGLWESIHIVGGSSQFAGMEEYLQLELARTVLPASNLFAISQTREIKFATMPDYFVGWRNHDYLASFLGACIVAKIALNDGKHNITRTEYNNSGPSIIHTKSF